VGGQTTVGWLVQKASAQAWCALGRARASLAVCFPVRLSASLGGGIGLDSVGVFSASVCTTTTGWRVLLSPYVSLSGVCLGDTGRCGYAAEPFMIMLL